MDRNGDGVVDDADSRERADQSAVGKRVAAAMRGRIDTNSDGKISKDEFVNAPTTLFDRFDADKTVSSTRRSWRPRVGLRSGCASVQKQE